MSKSFLANVAKSVLKTGTVDKAGCIGDINGWIDTGSYAFNALISASLYKGYPSNKITSLSGDPSCGKTFYAIRAMKEHLNSHKDNICIVLDSEAAWTVEMMDGLNLDTSRVIVKGIESIEKFANKTSNILTEWEETGTHKKVKATRLMLVLDSLGQLSSSKEIDDIEGDTGKRDFTKAALLKAAFRVLTIRCAELKVPLILCNHVYSAMEQYAAKVQSGGSGSVYSASSILGLSKSKIKAASGNITGAIIKITTMKSRISKENNMVETALDYDTGLDRWHGMLDLAKLAEVWEKTGKRFVVDGKNLYGKVIMKNPEKYFTPEVMEKIEAYVNVAFAYGSSVDTEVKEEEEVPADD